MRRAKKGDGDGERGRREEREERKNQINRRTWRIRGWSASRQEKRIARGTETRRNEREYKKEGELDSKKRREEKKRKSRERKCKSGER